MNPTLRKAVHFAAHVLSRPFFVWTFIDPKYRPRTEPGSDPLPKAPFIMVGNHGSFMDPWIIGRYSLAPVFYMCNDDAWRSSTVTQTYLDCIGAFPKKKGGADFRAIKTTLKILESGSPVCIFPEGQTSWTGETQLIYMGMEKLIKRAKVPLVICNLCGNFMIRPWWAESRRTGHVLVRVRVITPERIAAMSDEELFATVRDGIYQNEIKDPRNHAVAFRGENLTGGLDRVCWICMHCGVEDRLVMHGDDITCNACGRRWRMDAHFRLKAISESTTTLGDLKDWCDMQRQRVITAVGAAQPGVSLTSSDNVALETLESDGYTFAQRSRGTLAVTNERLTFTPSAGAEALSFLLSEIHDTVIQKKDIFEIRVKDTYYRFVFNRHSPMKWVYYLRYLQGYAEAEARGYL